MFQYFVFDFHMPPIMLFDKIITLSVSRKPALTLKSRLPLGQPNHPAGASLSEWLPIPLPAYLVSVDLCLVAQVR